MSGKGVENNHGQENRPRLTSGEAKRIMRKLPDRSNRPVLNLDLELFGRNNVALAVLVVLSALLRGSPEQQEGILERLKSDYLLGPKSIYSFLFRIIAEDLREYGEIDIPTIVKHIPDFGPQVYGEKSDRRSLHGDYANFAQILDLHPTEEQIAKAMQMVEIYAKKRGWAEN